MASIALIRSQESKNHFDDLNIKSIHCTLLSFTNSHVTSMSKRDRIKNFFAKEEKIFPIKMKITNVIKLGMRNSPVYCFLLSGNIYINFRRKVREHLYDIGIECFDSLSQEKMPHVAISRKITVAEKAEKFIGSEIIFSSAAIIHEGKTIPLIGNQVEILSFRVENEHEWIKREDGLTRKSKV